jgi:hypothetical protein
LCAAWCWLWRCWVFPESCPSVLGSAWHAANLHAPRLPCLPMHHAKAPNTCGHSHQAAPRISGSTLGCRYHPPVLSVAPCNVLWLAGPVTTQPIRPLWPLFIHLCWRGATYPSHTLPQCFSTAARRLIAPFTHRDRRSNPCLRYNS